MSEQSTFVLPAPPPAPPPVPARRRSGLVMVIAVTIAVVLVAAGLVVFRGGGRAEAVPLALHFTEGDSTTYTTSQTIDAEISAEGFGGEFPALGGIPLVMELSQTVTWDVVSVDEDGVATISVTTSDASASIAGIEAPSSDLEGPPVLMRMARDGRILSLGDVSFAGFEGGGLPGQGGLPGMGQVTPLLPEDGAPVAPGDTWDTSYSQDFPFASGSIDYDVHSTYVRNDEFGGVDAAVIGSTVSVPLDLRIRMRDVIAFLQDQEGAPPVEDLGELREATMTYEGQLEFEMTSFVDFAANELLRSESTGDFDVTMEIGGVPDFEGTIDLAGTFTDEMELR
jgi:hypothetical protein